MHVDCEILDAMYDAVRRVKANVIISEWNMMKNESQKDV